MNKKHEEEVGMTFHRKSSSFLNSIQWEGYRIGYLDALQGLSVTTLVEALKYVYARVPMHDPIFEKVSDVLRAFRGEDER